MPQTESNFRESLFVDPVHRAPRLWSNTQLRRVGALFDGDVVNVSAWRDEDKAGGHYRDYFPKARSYALTNFRSEMRGLQGQENETFLDLEQELPAPLNSAFDLVYNHTTLEHIYEFRRAFANLCAMSRDAVIVVVPWMQPYHSDYGDYWRFSPIAVARLFAENGFTPARIVWNGDAGVSVYVFAIGVRDPARWHGALEFDWDPARDDFLALRNDYAGRDALPKPMIERLRTAASAAGLGKLRRALTRGV